jgi:hypothetical protein
VAGVSPADIKELQPTRLPLQSGDKIFLKLRIFLPKFAIALCCNKLRRQSKTFFRFSAGAAAKPSRIFLRVPQTARPSASYRISGGSESTSGVKCVVLETEID